MQIEAIYAKDVHPIRCFEVTNLSDIVVIGGANGVGKTRLIQHVMNAFKSPNSRNPVRLIIRATNEEERKGFSSSYIDTENDADCSRLQAHLQQKTRRVKLKGRVLNFESDRSI